MRKRETHDSEGAQGGPDGAPISEPRTDKPRRQSLTTAVALRNGQGAPRPDSQSPMLLSRASVWASTLSLIVIAVCCSLTVRQVWRFAHAAHTTPAAAARDEALRSGRDCMIRFNSIDYHRAEFALQGWLGCSGGALRATLAATRQSAVRQIRAKHTSTTAHATVSGLTSYDAGAGTATMVAVIAVTGPDHRTVDKRFAGEVKLEAGSWKLTALQPIAVGS